MATINPRENLLKVKAIVQSDPSNQTAKSREPFASTN